MKKRKKIKTANVPKWKKGQVTAPRKPANSRSRKARKLPKAHSAGGFVRFLVLCLIAGAAVKYAGIPAARIVSSHPVFNVREVTVEGARYLDSEKVLATAGIEPGLNIFDVNFNGIKQTLKSEYTTEKFTVYRRLPYTVVIDIHERKPVALLNTKKLVGVDAEGVPLPHIGADMVESLPIVTGIRTVSALADSTTRARLLSGLQMLDRISEDAPAVYSRISEVDVSNLAEMGISLVDNGLQVIIGNRDWKNKIPNLDRVINEVTWRRENVKSVDIRFGDKVIVTK